MQLTCYNSIFSFNLDVMFTLLKLFKLLFLFFKLDLLFLSLNNNINVQHIFCNITAL